ncbi:chaoptin [Manduca sexta]|nr:chaoptin [Manduca sexta]
MPKVITNMINLKQLELINNGFESLILYNFMNQQGMVKMNLSHNAITTVDLNDVDPSERRVDALTTLDLSYNLIEVLPAKCFAGFPNLDNLDLSHNNLKTMDLFTFEGIAHLSTLYLSHNKLTTIGHSFVRFGNLKYLAIDHNDITDLLQTNLISMVKLENLNISYNKIENIENDAFKSLANLESLDITHNRIKIVKESLFKNATNLGTLLLAANEIESIEAEAFVGTNITNFSIENNCMSGTIVKDTFSGVKLQTLALSGGKIVGLGDSAFSALSENLVTLNLSKNSINTISTSAFKSLNELSVLDLSNNNISELNFDSSDIKKLTLFYAGYNKITKIYKSVFSHLSSLIELDLSHNIIKVIDLNTFDSLGQLKKLLLNDNDLANTIDSYAFSKLAAVNRIDFTNTKIATYSNSTFSNMTLLTTFISSSGQLTKVEYNAFLGTGSIVILDLSYNLLDDFFVNTTTINEVQKLHLNNNRITNITNVTFYGLKSLQMLDLSYNNLLNVESNSFRSLSSLIRLDLSSNLDMYLTSNIFDNLTWLEDVTLNNIRKKFDFKDATNTSISKLFLSKHHIDNINDVFVFHVKNIEKLDLSSNKITYVDKFSFQIMGSLTWLDLSCNMITDIQPGSFSHMNLINEINLHGNGIQSFQYGVLDGLRNLRTLNLSNNALHIFEATVLHPAPLLEYLSLENNAIKTISFLKLGRTNLNTLYIGGNPIPCSSLVELNTLPRLVTYNVTAENLDYGSENVHGITCKSSFQDVFKAVYNNSGGNLTILFRELAKTVVDLQETLKNIANNTLTKENSLKDSLINVAKSVDLLATLYNKSQIASERNLNKFMRVLNESEHKNRSNVATNTSELANEGTALLRGYLKDTFVNWQHDSKPEGDDYKEITFLLYVIAICFVLTLVSVVGFGLYKFVISKSKRHLMSQSTQPIIGNAIEMD